MINRNVYSAELGCPGALNCNDSSEKTMTSEWLSKHRVKANDLSLFGLNVHLELCLSPRNLLHFTLALVALRGDVGIKRACVVSV